MLVIFDGDLALFSTGDAGAYPFVFQRFPEPIGVIAAISEQPIGVRQAAEQRLRPDVTADLSGRDEEVDRAPLTVADGMQLRIRAALGATPSRAIASQYPAGQWIRRPRPPFLRPGWTRCDGLLDRSHPLTGSGLLANRERGSSLSSSRRAEPPDQPSFAQRCLYRSIASNGCIAFYVDHTLSAHHASVSHRVYQDNPTQNAPPLTVC